MPVLRLGRLHQLWRQLLRQETPRQALASWRHQDLAAVALVCALVAVLSSWPWLVAPNLRPGMIAPSNNWAPKSATVVDSEALDQRRAQLGSRTHVQVVDRGQSLALQQRLERQLKELERLAPATEGRLAPIELTPQEQLWLNALPAADRRRWEQALHGATERMLSQGVVASLARRQLEQAALLQLAPLGEPARGLGAKLLANTLQGASNLRIDAALSQQLIEEALTQQGLPLIHVKKGDQITRRGEPISSQSFDVLDYFGLVNRRPLLRAWLAHFTEALAVSAVMVLMIRRWRASLEPRQALLALAMLLVVQALKLWLGVAVNPLVVLVAPTLLVAQGLGTASGLAWLAAASLLWPVPYGGLSETRLLIAAVVAAAAAILAGRQRSRAQLLQLAVLLPGGALILEWLLLQSTVLTGRNLGVPNSVSELLGEAVLVGGLLMAGLLVAPLVESFFGLLTRARLLELADHELPLLRRLSCEAPGTFEHTLMICGLAEEGARAIHADVDLIRTGALYHDVGKMHAPQWFIENQADGLNPHEALDDPYASAAILQAHVDEGLKLARRYHLPRPLADFIPEHQGTLKMGYFLHQARERDPDFDESRFRYRGPTPRSRETGILMLADGCEAALRSLPPDTSELQAGEMVRRIVDARQNDGQLAASGLSRGELEILIRSFVGVWKRMRHRRIPYPIPAKKAFSA
ncbi:HDIG domain-containing metalloprotein [Cyanobium sp. Morenito 9A2]|uniref:HDIG domain-containing metalloprotein n=1 Tax=Cyanobium sp. Morenito 9A2 TaxID=2823718 RepID=UPI0020CBF88E|nr:HDIG domain-containing metalloprotein [Cyanobium sp. Morenito 9A2]MCP9848365.1 HDIG domain-containing protein [Cyanobium sp. Morenito 9A2]